ncbi:MAG: hypothetical protein FD161_3003 [Limisphaerales bacterium]|nr:MAG: hypothetical protein FD161_3003 [Limisphaerales bacterium]KAG0508116.1 MAG: hypothetical protein E1N63_2710 [Limisphaerales bacterium]TXT53031.1 MAG: hypothetical protein FD140_139 [Limisphaerales bacterium]
MNDHALTPAPAANPSGADERLHPAGVAFPAPQTDADARIVAAAFRETILRAQSARAAKPNEPKDQSPILDV